MSIFERHPKDYVGIWFEQRKKFGINDIICWARYTPESGVLKMHKFHHGNGDGVSVILHLLNKAGHVDNEIPQCKESRIPSNKEIKTIQRKMSRFPKKVKWRYWQPDTKQTLSTFNTLFFNKGQTKAIEERAKLLKVSVSTLVLWSLNRSASLHLLEPSQQYTWFYPVNLRGAVDYGTDYANYSSGFYLPVDNDISLNELNQRVRQKLKSGEHWVSWQQAKITKWLPNFVIRLIYKTMSKKQFYAGSFSFLGNWSKEAAPISESQEDLRQERWFGCPPGTKNYPISNVVINWNGQLSLSLKLHQSIVKNPESAVTTLCEWANLLMDVQGFRPEDALTNGDILSYTYDEAQEKLSTNIDS